LAKKVLTIILLSISLGAFLYLRPYLFKKEVPARIIDRLPNADFLGRVNVLELARETSGMMYYNKIPFRDFTSYEFILGQSKMYGLNLQKPVYLFGNEAGDWGAIIQVSDSAKMSQGIERIKNFLNVRDTILMETKVWYYPTEKMYLHYGKNYLLLYQGSNFKKNLSYVLNARIYRQSKEWRTFLSQKQFNKEHLVIYSNWIKLRQFGIETAMFAHDSDSLSFNLKSYLRKKTPFYLKKKNDGIAISSVLNANKSVELHLDIREIKNHPEDSMLIGLIRYGKRIGFPLNDFIKSWDGDLCFVEGGTQKVKEKYITTELDDDFNVTEVEKTREVDVPGYSVVFSTTSYAPIFINKLFQKGILTKDGEQFRFLFSPLLHFSKTGNFMKFYSGETSPRLIKSNKNNVVWTDRGTRYSFSIDSLNRNEVFGSMQIPVKRIIRRNKLI
jgi:hypothetical protein